MKISFLAIFLGLIFSGLFATSRAEDCPALNLPLIPAEKVYSGLPFSPGEQSEYAVSYMGISAGRAYLEVRPPILHNGFWQRVYAAEAQTGKWYRAIFIAHDSILSYNYPPNGVAAYFTLNQDEGKLLEERTRRRTEINFDPHQCAVREIVQEHGKTTQSELISVSPGVIDVLGAIFQLRTYNYQNATTVRFPVYSSKKSWFLEGQIIGRETIKVPAGSFSTVKLRLHTYVADLLQQKGDLLFWIAADRSARPLIQVKAEVRIGSIMLQLTHFRPGIPWD